jgi:flagellar biosynthesis GTPase FlhF
MATASRSRVPIGYLSLGPRIPDDLARPGVESLVDSVLQPEVTVEAS